MRGLAILTLVATLAACGDDKEESEACTKDNAENVTTISIQDEAFVPSCAKVALNAAVTFTNDDNTDHTVTTDSGQAETFDSGVLTSGQDFTHTFATAGTIKYHCDVHSGMKATVFVD